LLARKGFLSAAPAGHMDSPKRVSSAATAGGLDIFTHLDNLCQQKGYSSDIRAGSVELLQRLQTSDDHVSPQMSDHGKLAAVVFLASTMGKPLPGISVAELTTQLALHLKDFFTGVKDVHSRLFPGKEMGELQPVMQAYVTTAMMHDKWKTSSRDLFPNGIRASDEEACMKELSFDLGWWLFALARFHEASRASDAVCSSISSISSISQLDAVGSSATAASDSSKPHRPNSPVPTGENQHRECQLLVLPTALVEHVLSFLPPIHLAKTRPACSALCHAAATAAHVQALRAGLQSDWQECLRLEFEMPRGTQALHLLWMVGLGKLRWLTRAAPTTSDTGASSSGLAKFFECAAGLSNVKATVQERLARLLRAARNMLLDNEQGPSKEAVEAVEEQLELSERLYFKMLLSFLMAEEKRLGNSDFSELLANEAFHTSLLACCLESVFASYSTPGMGFPEVLRVLSLKAFDFAKVIESFIRHEPHLPAHLKLHFADVESKIIESLAWCDDSPLHSLMAEYDATLLAAGASSAGPSRARAALEQFVRKYLYLAAKRIQELCQRLLLDAALTQQVWDVFLFIINSARDLLVGRHLDQILMCAVFGVCKVNQRQVTFRQIIEQYKRQPGASPRTFREVRMATVEEEPQDIIQFYNMIFIPKMEEHLNAVRAAGWAPTSGPSTAGAA